MNRRKQTQKSTNVIPNPRKQANCSILGFTCELARCHASDCPIMAQRQNHHKTNCLGLLSTTPTNIPPLNRQLSQKHASEYEAKLWSVSLHKPPSQSIPGGRLHQKTEHKRANSCRSSRANVRRSN